METSETSETSEINKIIESVLSMREVCLYKHYLYWPEKFTEEEMPDKVKTLLHKVKEYERNK